MRLHLDLPHRFNDVLVELALENYRTVQGQAAYLLSKGIEAALREREEGRERYFAEMCGPDAGPG